MWPVRTCYGPPKASGGMHLILKPPRKTRNPLILHCVHVYSACSCSVDPIAMMGWWNLGSALVVSQSPHTVAVETKFSTFDYFHGVFTTFSERPRFCTMRFQHKTQERSRRRRAREILIIGFTRQRPKARWYRTRTYHHVQLCALHAHAIAGGGPEVLCNHAMGTWVGCVNALIHTYRVPTRNQEPSTGSTWVSSAMKVKPTRHSLSHIHTHHSTCKRSSLWLCAATHGTPVTTVRAASGLYMTSRRGYQGGGAHGPSDDRLRCTVRGSRRRPTGGEPTRTAGKATPPSGSDPPPSSNARNPVAGAQTGR